MKKIRCYDCGKSYDYHEDAFCPNCGAFNQPPRASRIAADGSIVRNDGINENNHEGSFVHRELHEETRERRRSGLDKGARRVPRPAADTPKTPPNLFQTRQSRERKKGKPIGAIVWVILLIMLFNILSRIFFFL